ncbi:MAG: hypothetical protein FVQ81_09165 [Candidatus Glassbacteria bacterium]|nr:hypothetical protein [Candidatus Glassbacteria bacterium]
MSESMLYNLAVVWRPGDRDTVRLNPPRFSWPYEPTIMLPPGREDRNHLPIRHWRFQVSADPDFDSVLVDIPATPFNFYNTLSPFPAPGAIYWRVGYYDPELVNGIDWRKTRSFVIAPEAVTWDRSGLAKPDFKGVGHPRIIFTRSNTDSLRALARTHPFSREIYEKVLGEATADLRASWFADFPRTDTIGRDSLRALYPDIPAWPDPDGGDDPYMLIIERLMNMAFAHMLTGDNRFLAVAGRMVTVAGWTTGGATAPSGTEGGGEDAVALNEYLSLFYDWFHDRLTADMRKIVLESLRWRTDHIVNSYSWRQRRGTRVSAGSIAVGPSSHPFENINYTVPAGLAAYEEGGIFQTTYELAVNYYTGVNSPFGQDAWNEGPGYGLSKFKWHTFAVSYYDMALADANFGRNPFLHDIGEWFTRTAVMGLPHLSFGNIGLMEPYYLNNRVSSFRKLAYLTGNARFLTGWSDALRRLEQIGYGTHRKYHRPWIEYALPHYYKKPETREPAPRSRLFPDGGWVSASNLYPGELDNFADNVGITFRARPRGAYNHSFFSDNGYQIYAYGENITHAGGSTQNGDRHAHHSMSHNIVLVDGLGQAQPNPARMNNFRLELHNPWAARIERYAERDGTVYIKGEAANSYIQYPYLYREFWGKLGDGTNDPYEERDLSYLLRADRHVLFVDGRYFVMLDDLEVDSAQRPEGSTFSWLYHVLQEVPLEWDGGRGEFTYTLGGVNILVSVAADRKTEFEDRLAGQGLVNPITGEDYRPHVRPITRYDRNWEGDYPEVVTHNIWLSNTEPCRRIRYLAVIYPWREGDPAPEVVRLDRLSVRVIWGGDSEVITFDPAAHPDADIRVVP